MSVHGLKAVFVAHNHIEAVTATLIFCEAHSAAESSIHSVADGCANVHALMCALEASAVAVRRGDKVLVNWHHIVAHVDSLAAGYVCVFIGVYQSAFPAFSVDVGFWLYVLPERPGVFLVFFEMYSLVEFRLACEFIGMRFTITCHRA